MIARRRTGLGTDETGATAIEYALLAGLIAMVIIGATYSMGMKLNGIFTNANDELVQHMVQPAP